MKNISVKQLIKEVDSITTLNYYKTISVDKDYVRDNDIVISSEDNGDVDGEVGKVTVNRLTKVGIAINDIFVTIDRINSINTRKKSSVVDDHKIEDYQLLDCLKPFIRPGAITATGEMSYNYQVDLLEDYENLAEFPGTILDPKEFNAAQLTLMKALNPKYTELHGVSAISRTRTAIQDADVYSRPTLIDGQYRMVTKVDQFSLFGLKFAFADPDSYDTILTNRSCASRLTVIATEMIAASNSREAKSSSRPDVSAKATDAESK